MGRKSILVVCALALAAVGAFAGVSLAGGGNETSNRVEVLRPTTGVAKPGGEAGTAARAKGHKGHKKKAKKPTVQFFYATQKLVPPEGGGVVGGLKCPSGKGEPIAGGAITDEGIVVSYLSRVKPGTNKTPKRTYYVGVDDNSDDVSQAGAGAYIEIQCAKSISVKY